MDTRHRDSWEEIISNFRRYKPSLFSYIVKWILPKQSRMKYNTDGTCKGNPSWGSYGFALKDQDGNLVYA